MEVSRKLAEDLHAWVQLLLAMMPLGAALMKLILDLRRRPQELETTEKEKPSELPSSYTSPQRLSDLALTLGYAALFSLLLTFALGMSGRILAWYELAGVSLGLTLLIGAILVLSWHRSQAAAALAGLAVLSFLVVAIAPGGAFSHSQATEASAPVFTLFTISIVAGTFLFYLRGKLPAFLGGPHRPWILPTILACLCGIGAWVGGLGFSRSTFAENGAPSLVSDGRILFRRLIKTPAASQALFYQLASEIVLVPYYRTQYLTPPADLSRLRSERSASDERASAGDDGSVDMAEEPRMQPSFLEYPTKPEEPEKAPPPAEVQEALLLSALALPQPEVYMLNRLSWVHPLGPEGRKASIYTPGRTATARLEGVARYRIFKSLSENHWLQPLLYNPRYSYPDYIRAELRDHIDENPFPSLSDDLRSGSKELLVGFSPHSANLILKIQMALPFDAEGRIAFTQYRQFALDRQRDARTALLAKNFEKLPPEVKRAYIHYVANEAAKQRYELLREISVLNADIQGAYNPVADVAYLHSQLPGLLSLLPPAAVVATNSQVQPRTTSEPVTSTALAPLGDSPSPPDLQSQVEKGATELSVSTEPAPSHAVEQLITALRRHFSSISSRAIRAELGETLGALLQANDATAPVMDLLRPESFEFAKLIDAQALNEVDLRTFFEVIGDPVSPALTSMIQRASIQSTHTAETKRQLIEDLSEFKRLPGQQQEAILDLLAHRLYRERPGHFMSLAMANAQIFGYHLDVLLATMIFAPLFVIGLFVANYFSRLLNAQDVLRHAIIQEVERGASPLPTFAIGTSILGRRTLLKQLAKLVRKGWGTIALVGQRGVGKTRVLQELLIGTQEEWRQPAIGVWITAPARFDEREFISSALSQAAMQVERTVAHHLGAQPIAARRLEVRLRRGSLTHFGILVASFWIATISINENLPEPLFALALTPTLLLMTTAVCIESLYLLKLQPIDLRQWLQARQSAHSQDIMMYTEAMETLNWITPEKRTSLWRKSSPWWLRVIIAIVVAFLLLMWVSDTLISRQNLYFFIIILTLLIFIQSRMAAMSVEPERGELSLMSLLRAYRDYIASVVRRIELGALSDIGQQSGVVICIDELDKITDLEEIRNFVRRIKGIFEVPGVHYYLSLAEDAFGALYLGSVDGKNEIDSSFDHVVRIRPLDIEEAEDIVKAYCQRVGIEMTVEPRLARAIAAVTFGVPRDSLRLCSEIAALWDEVPDRRTERSLRNRRELESRLVYELRRIDHLTASHLSDSPEKCREFARQFFASEVSRPLEVARLILSCWLLAVVECALETTSEALWLEVSSRCAEIGSQSVVVPLYDLIEQAMSLDGLLRQRSSMEQTGT